MVAPFLVWRPPAYHTQAKGAATSTHPFNRFRDIPYNGLKFAKDSLTALMAGKIEAESQSRILAALEKLGTAQDTLFQLREELFALQAENAKLKQDIDSHNKWQERLGAYELARTAGGAVVYRFKGDAEHFACPSCTNKKELQILQDNRTMSGKYRCVGCGAEYPINPRETPPDMPQVRYGRR